MPIVLAYAEPPAAAVSSMQTPSVASAPDWELQPDFADFVNAFPPEAGVHYTEGRTIITCTVGGDGRLKFCLVVSEDPVGAGFGDAALKLSHLFKARPTMRDGHPASGEIVRIPMRFPRPPSAPASTSAAPARIAAVDWARLPTGKDLAHVYPPAAARAGIDGQGALRCTFTATGDLTDCTVKSESPAGYGFGDAALKLAKYFQLRITPGHSPAGIPVDIPLRFRPPD